MFAEASNDGNPIRVEMNRDRQMEGTENGFVYKALVPATRPSGDFTARIVPHYPGVAIPHEDTHILWQR